MQKIGERIRSIRDEMDLPRSEFAALLGISHTALYNYEISDRIPNADMILKICEMAKIVPLWLLTGKGVQKYEDIPLLLTPIIEDILTLCDMTLQNKLSEDEKILLSHKLRNVLGISIYGLLNDSYTAKRDIKSINTKNTDSNNTNISANGNNNIVTNGNNNVSNNIVGDNNINVSGKLEGGINVHTKTKKVNMNIQPPAGTIGANALLVDRIESLFNKLGLIREESFGKNAYKVMYSNFKRDFSIPKHKSWTSYKLWPEIRGQEIIDYLNEKLENTKQGRIKNAFEKKGHDQKYLLGETTRLHKMLGWTEQDYRGKLHYRYEVTSRADLQPDQLADYVAYLKQEVDRQ